MIMDGFMKNLTPVIFLIFSMAVISSEEEKVNNSVNHIEPGLTLFIVSADDYEARSGMETKDATMHNGYGVDFGYQFTVFPHLRINPYIHYRNIQFTSMIEDLKTDKANVLGIATTFELDWSPRTTNNLMNKSLLYIPLYILKLGLGVNIISFEDSNYTLYPALSYSLGFGVPLKRLSIHVGGEGNLFYYNSKFSELDAYKLKVGYWF